MSCLAILLGAGSAKATSVPIDQIIFQSSSSLVNPSGGDLSGTVDVTQGATSNQLIFLLTNTTSSSAFSDSNNPSTELLTDFAFALGSGTTSSNGITGGSAVVNTGSTALNFPSGQSTTDISNQWGFANHQVDGFQPSSIPGVELTNTTISTIEASGMNHFASGLQSIDGPSFGAISKSLVNAGLFGNSLAGVEDTIKFTVNFTSAIAPTALTSVVLSFGSPDTLASVPDNGSTLALLGVALIGVGFLRRKMSNNPLTLA